MYTVQLRNQQRRDGPRRLHEHDDDDDDDYDESAEASSLSGGQTGEWALVQEEQMSKSTHTGKNFTKQINRDNKH